MYIVEYPTLIVYKNKFTNEGEQTLQEYLNEQEFKGWICIGVILMQNHIDCIRNKYQIIFKKNEE